MSYVMIQLDDAENDQVSIDIDFQPPLPEGLTEESELTPAQLAGIAISNFILHDLFAAIEPGDPPDASG